jgi:ribonuclease III
MKKDKNISPEIEIGQYYYLLKSIGYQFTDITLLKTALTHKSALGKDVSTHGSNNERLEFLGDAVLSLVAANYLYRENSFLNEGDLSRLRAQFVCKENLSQAAKKIDLGEFVISDKSMRSSGSTNSKTVLADTLEALIGAVYLDGGFKIVEQVIYKTLGFPSMKLDDWEKDAKTKLQEIVQANIQIAPKYIVLESSGPAHAPVFLVGVKIHNDMIATATGGNKKSATQNAAIVALEKFTQRLHKGY